MSIHAIRGFIALLALPLWSTGPEMKAPNITGSYYFGDGLGVNCRLDLKGDRTFTYAWHGCLGLYDHNLGKYSIEGDEIILHPQLPNVKQGLKGTDTRFYVVPWGNRVYLISEEKMLSFCSRVAHGWRGNEWDGIRGFYYLKFDPDTVGNSARKPLSGIRTDPAVPAFYKKFLKNPPAGKIVKELPDGRVVVSMGNDMGVRKTMMLGIGETWLRVLSVSDHTCECEIWSRGPKTIPLGSVVKPVEFF